MKSEICARLEIALHDKFLSCGEILSADAIAEFISDIEYSGEFSPGELSADDIRLAVYDASDRFVDSMQGNCLDTWQGQGCKGKPGEWLSDESAYDDQMARYESMRPRNQRKAAIIASLSAPAEKMHASPAPAAEPQFRATIKKDAFGDYAVRLYGKASPRTCLASYFSPDKDDAKQTADKMLADAEAEWLAFNSPTPDEIAFNAGADIPGLMHSIRLSY